MVINHRAGQRRGVPGRQMLVVADPVYGLDDLRLGVHVEQPAKERARVWPLNLLLRGGQVEGPLPRLPGTAREASIIAAAFPKGSVDRLEGFTATRERFLGAGLDRYQFIHIAAHAIADSDVPQASALLLSRFDNRSQEIDGRVLAADFMNVQLNAQTVVLSACDTAMGRNISGEGLMGLRYVVLARGARAVIASMWPVADQVSAELMANFYGTLLRNGLRVAPALSDAMRAEIAGRFRDPGLWAAYALTVADLDGA
jgi:CHAT domain-containing protein